MGLTLKTTLSPLKGLIGRDLGVFSFFLGGGGVGGGGRVRGRVYYYRNFMVIQCIYANSPRLSGNLPDRE